MWQIKFLLDLPALMFCSWHVYKMASKLLEWKRALLRILKELDLSPLANTRFGGSRVNRESAWSLLTRAKCHASHPRNKGHHANWHYRSIRSRCSIWCWDSHRSCKVKKGHDLTIYKFKVAEKEKREKERTTMELTNIWFRLRGWRKASKNSRESWANYNVKTIDGLVCIFNPFPSAPS